MPPVGKEKKPIGGFRPVESEKNRDNGRVGEYRVDHHDIEARPRRKYKLWRNSGATMTCAHGVVGQKTSFEFLKGGVVELRRNPDCAEEVNKHRSQGKALHIFRALCSDPGG